MNSIMKNLLVLLVILSVPKHSTFLVMRLILNINNQFKTGKSATQVNKDAKINFRILAKST